MYYVGERCIWVRKSESEFSRFETYATHTPGHIYIHIDFTEALFVANNLSTTVTPSPSLPYTPLTWQGFVSLDSLISISWIALKMVPHTYPRTKTSLSDVRNECPSFPYFTRASNRHGNWRGRGRRGCTVRYTVYMLNRWTYARGYGRWIDGLLDC